MIKSVKFVRISRVELLDIESLSCSFFEVELNMVINIGMKQRL